MIIFATALYEEILETTKYCNKNFERDIESELIYKTISNSISVFKLDLYQKCILVYTGAGIVNTEKVLSKLYRTLRDTNPSDDIVKAVYFAGTALGISSTITLGDKIKIKCVFHYDKEPLYSEEEVGAILTGSHTLFDNGSGQTLGIAISGNTFVNVQKQRRIYENNTATKNQYSFSNEQILPRQAYILLEYINRYAEKNNIKPTIILDMESAAVRSVFLYLNTVEIMRIVLDHVEDTRPIDFRKELGPISVQIKDWFVEIADQLISAPNTN